MEETKQLSGDAWEQDFKNKAKERMSKHLKQRSKNGKKLISAVISIESYEIINNLRDASIKAGKPLSAGQIIEQALLAIKNKQFMSLQPECFQKLT